MTSSRSSRKIAAFWLCVSMVLIVGLCLRAQGGGEYLRCVENVGNCSQETPFCLEADDECMRCTTNQIVDGCEWGVGTCEIDLMYDCGDLQTRVCDATICSGAWVDRGYCPIETAFDCY